MSLILNSSRTIAYSSIMGGAPAFLIGASKLSRTIFHPPRRSSCSKVVQQEAPKAVTVPQKTMVRRMPQRYRIEQISARPGRQQMPRKLAATTYRAGQSGRSWSWRDFYEVFWTSLFGFIYDEFCNSLEAESSSEAESCSEAESSSEANGPQDESTEKDTVEEFVWLTSR
ncbi:hypothetical protein GQ44DRAFT_763685 [Phaeosphaeriaceae sp. PMI808]|nr:hypothetical protein GQ44DRAFT_763685 [Phaeosphaeriaceae sp. PMI808]